MALDYCQSLVSALYLVNKLMEFDQMLHTQYALTLTRSRLGLLCVNRVVALYYHQNFVAIQYLVNKLVEFDQIFAYALFLTRSRLGL